MTTSARRSLVSDTAATIVPPHLLAESVRADDLAVAAALLRQGADANARDPLGYPPLLLAAGLGHRQMVELLLSAGADPLLPDARMCRTALHAAAQGGVVDVARLLLARGAVSDVQAPTHGHTALMDAVMHKRLPMVRFLCDAGANLSIRAHGMLGSQYTARELARARGFEAIAEALDGAERDRADAVRQLTLHAAVKAGDLNAVRNAIAAGAAIDDTYPVVGDGDDGHTALTLAARDGHTEIVRELLAAGARPDIVDHFMKATPGHKAAVGGHAEILRLLGRRLISAQPQSH